MIKFEPGKDGATVTFVFLCSAYFGMGFPIRLNSIFLGALLTFPLLVAVLSAKVLFNASEIT